MFIRGILRSLFLLPLVLINFYAGLDRQSGDNAQELAAEAQNLLQKMDQRAEHYGQISRRIWEFAEVGYKEKQSSELLKAELRTAGFQITENVGEIPTAFSASWGSGKPVIGILGEYDALPGLSQDSVPEKNPRVAGAPGHGCGHNLFGVASAFAAVAIKEYLVAGNKRGTIRFYGAPAEEGGGGKIYMARAGAFNDCDIVLAWHPGNANAASLGTSLANMTAKFRFHGQAAHAAANPDKGRSALDAVMLTAHAVDMLREHVPQETRIHYVVTNGGEAPNVVPDFSEIWVYARHPDMAMLDNIWSRIVKCADAGALATETRLETQLVNSVYNLLPNEPLANLLDKNLRHVGGMKYTAEEKAFAEKLRRTFSTEGALPLGSEAQVQPLRAEAVSGSTDVADVSWIVPTAQFTTATYVPGTPGHSWQSTACTGTSIGRKGMVIAAKTLALSAVDLLNDPRLIESARTDFNKRRAGQEYKSRIPMSQKPPLNYRDKSQYQ